MICYSISCYDELYGPDIIMVKSFKVFPFNEYLHIIFTAKCATNRFYINRTARACSNY